MSGQRGRQGEDTYAGRGVSCRLYLEEGRRGVSGRRFLVVDFRVISQVKTKMSLNSTLSGLCSRGTPRDTEHGSPLTTSLLFFFSSLKSS